MNPTDFYQMWPRADKPIPVDTASIPEETMNKIREQMGHKVKLVSNEPVQAIKFDDGKVDWSLVPFEALEGMVKVLEFGAKKYAAWNWTEGGGFKWTRLVGSCLRHLFAWARGQDNDPESGLSHIYHAQCNLLFLAYYIGNKEKFNKDDRNVR